jgi:hypothetical protein
MLIWLEDGSKPNKFKKPTSNSDFVEHLKNILVCLFDDLLQEKYDDDINPFCKTEG